jgi:hypothetical protein
MCLLVPKFIALLFVGGGLQPYMQLARLVNKANKITDKVKINQIRLSEVIISILYEFNQRVSFI